MGADYINIVIHFVINVNHLHHHYQMGVIILVAMAMVTTVTALKGSLYSPMYQQLGPSIFNSVTLLVAWEKLYRSFWHLFSSHSFICLSIFSQIPESGMDFSNNESPNYPMLMESPFCNCNPSQTGRWRCCNFCCTQVLYSKVAEVFFLIILSCLLLSPIKSHSFRLVDAIIHLAVNDE